MKLTLAFLLGYTIASVQWIVVVLCVMGAEEHPDDRRRREGREAEKPQKDRMGANEACKSFRATWEGL